jgi:hypothetical protein
MRFCKNTLKKLFLENKKQKRSKTVALVFWFFIVLKLQKLFFGEYLLSNLKKQKKNLVS